MRILLSCVVLGLVACGPSARGPDSGPLSLAVRPEHPTAGDSVELTLANGTEGTVRYNLCTAALQRETGAGWATVESDRVCTMELRGLLAGEDARYTLALPSDLEPGTYRFTTEVEVEAQGPAGRNAVSSDGFRVGS